MTCRRPFQTPTFETFVTHEPEPEARDATIELVGTNLRLSCLISLGRFPRLTDLIGSTSGYIRVRDARLLASDGSVTGEVIPLLMVNQDEISFIAEPDAPLHEPGTERGLRRAGRRRQPRRSADAPVRDLHGRPRAVGLGLPVRRDGSVPRSSSPRTRTSSRSSTSPPDRWPTTASWCSYPFVLGQSGADARRRRPRRRRRRAAGRSGRSPTARPYFADGTAAVLSGGPGGGSRRASSSSTTTRTCWSCSPTSSAPTASRP